MQSLRDQALSKFAVTNETRRESYVGVKKIRGRRHMQILWVLWNAKSALSSESIENIFKSQSIIYKTHDIRPRITELLQLGFVDTWGTCISFETKKKVACYQIPNNKRDEVADMLTLAKTRYAKSS